MYKTEVGVLQTENSVEGAAFKTAVTELTQMTRALATKQEACKCRKQCLAGWCPHAKLNHGLAVLLFVSAVATTAVMRCARACWTCACGAGGKAHPCALPAAAAAAAQPPAARHGQAQQRQLPQRPPFSAAAQAAVAAVQSMRKSVSWRTWGWFLMRGLCWQ